MALIREGNKAVLLVVDVQVGVMRDAWNAHPVIDNILKAVKKARSWNVPVIWVQHADAEMIHDSPDWALVPELSPREDELHIEKQFNSCFEQTPLDDILTQMGASQIILAGAATNWCIRATAYAALERGYDLTLLSDAHSTGTIEIENGARIEAAGIIRELNIAMSWLAYPGRTNRAITVDELDLPTSPLALQI